MTRFATIQDVIDYIAPAFGDFADDYDIDAIAREISDYRDGALVIVTDEDEDSAGELPEFWAIAQKHNIAQEDE